jgi:hypothetical protein
MPIILAGLSSLATAGKCLTVIGERSVNRPVEQPR